MNILERIGNTALVEVTRLDAGPCRLFVKLENQNPGGSIKDRIALAMVESAEREGKLAPGWHHDRGDGGQHRARPGADRRTQGLSPASSSSPTR